MVGYFALCVPAGLSLYYMANTVLTGLMQVYLRKLGGATVKVKDLGPVTKVGSARRLGALAMEPLWEYEPPAAAAAAGADGAAAAEGEGGGEEAGADGAAALEGRVFYARRKRAAAAVAAAVGGGGGSGSGGAATS